MKVQHYATIWTDKKSTPKKLGGFFENRRVARWHKSIELLTEQWTMRPVDVTGKASPFLYDETRLLTTELLSRIKSQEDTDRRLLDLIKDHHCKEVAFAAVVSYLSHTAVQNFLNTQFEASSDKAITIEPFLQAFVAAARWRPDEFSASDMAFASTLVAVANDGGAIQGSTIRTLLSAWKSGLPTHEGLRSRAVSLTVTVFHNAKLKLEHFHSRLAWQSAREYREPLKSLPVAFQAAGETFEGCVKAFLPNWRCWAEWSPDERLMDALEQRRRLGCRRFGCLQELEYPDLAAIDDVEPTVWQALIKRQQLIPWLESKGFKIGLCLIVGDIEPMLTDFMLLFKKTLSLALNDDETSIRLLGMYIDREGLDSGTLVAWQDLRRVLLKPMPEMAAYLADATTANANIDDFDILVTNALQALDPESCASARCTILKEMASAAQLACDKLDTSIRVYMPLLAFDYEWLGPALRRWQLRAALAQSTWLHSKASKGLLRSSTSQPPTGDLQILNELHVRVKTYGKATLLNVLESYIHRYLLDGDVRGTHLARSLHNLWTKTDSKSRREASINLAAFEKLSTGIRSSCITALSGIKATLARKLSNHLLEIKVNVKAAFVDLTKIVVSLSGPETAQACWAELLRNLLKVCAVSIDQQAFTDRGYEAYSLWIEQLHILYDGRLSLSRDTHSWLQQLKSCSSAVESLEGAPEGKKVLNHLLVTLQPEKCNWHHKLLSKISGETRKDRRAFMCSLLLSLKGSNASKICTTVYASAALDDNEFSEFKRFFDLGRKDKDLATARLAIYLKLPECSPTLKAVFIDVGQLLGLKETQLAWLAAKQRYDTQVQDLLDRAKKLENARMALMRTNRSEVETMMREQKIEAPAGVSAIIAELPVELLDVIEDVAEDQLELHFSLSGLHSLNKLALGVHGTETVVVTLRTFGGGVVDAFCVHVEEEVGVAPTTSHTWTKFRDDCGLPTHFSCHGERTRLEFIVSRAVWRTLQSGGLDIAKLYARVKNLVHNSANECNVCAADIGARLHRATRCGSALCNLLARDVGFDVQIEPLRRDSRAMDLMLTSVYAAALTRKSELLPRLPDVFDRDVIKLVALLDALPATQSIAQAVNVYTSLKQVAKNGDLFASWLCNMSRTYVISAKGHWKIPNMPGIHQFLVVDNPPEIEAAFANHNHIQPRMVLFHGTSMDRLYSIFAQGLRVLSNTPLMKHGAVSGPGIYFSTETSMPASYAASTSRVVRQPAFFRSRKDFDGPQVLLGCEHAGPANKGGVFVVTDPTKVIVRYIFLVPKGVAFPVAKDIIAPMISTFHSLRASAAVSK